MTLEAFLQSAWGNVVLILIILWHLPWKGYALWKAARRKEIIWFVLIFLVYTLAILEIFYIFYVARDHARKVKKGWKCYRKRKK